jgi:hypothetical protein
MHQIPLYIHPGDFRVGPMKPTGGCMNCPGNFYNAYNAPSPFFYVPTKLSNKEYIPYEGAGKMKKRKKKSKYDLLPEKKFPWRPDLSQKEIDDYERYLAEWEYNEDEKVIKKLKKRDKMLEKQKAKEEADNDWFSLVKELIPLGYEIADIAKIFYKVYSGKYGSSFMNEMMNIEPSGFVENASALGYRTYM